MNDSVLKMVEEVIESRKTEDAEGSYTCYLFKSGLDKILKKVGEECTETVIAAKNLKAHGTEKEKEELIGEVADLFYHLQVMLSDLDLSIDDVLLEHEKRNLKVNNKKQFKVVDKNT
jgi:phosphoribosyl-ATP pyrophosphohydrolase